MTFLEAIYGSQYYEIYQRGSDGNIGRRIGNFFLSAIIILFLIAFLMSCIDFIPGFYEDITRFIRNLFGNRYGDIAGKILAVPLYFLINVIVANKVGNKENFKKYVDAFMQYPDKAKKKALTKILIPFFVLLVIVFVLAIAEFRI